MNLNSLLKLARAQGPLTSTTEGNSFSSQQNLETVFLSPMEKILSKDPPNTSSTIETLSRTLLAPARSVLLPSLWTIKYMFQSLVTATGPKLGSDVSVTQLYTLKNSPGVENVMVLFHATSCGPCRVIETAEYQQALQTFNDKHPHTKMVTLEIDNPLDPFVEKFMTQIQPIKRKRTDPKTGKRITQEINFYPSSLLLHTTTARYARSGTIPNTENTLDHIELLTQRGFLHPNDFPHSFPEIQSLFP